MLNTARKAFYHESGTNNAIKGPAPDLHMLRQSHTTQHTLYNYNPDLPVTRLSTCACLAT
ncbi:hypothetical protein CBOM_07418 [Ceraceosorus bombacis]|uniref:Uncharacterized protein n=1 Tax=Ceraceosorus bombacis TaxID=401625 RepID=A0A0P1BBG0_9BASI|nr:hypothetical protein CBOM_07418 [Ceraceosorus bombacis]